MQTESLDIWNSLVPRLLHPLKLAMIEALIWIDQPLSAKDMAAVLAPEVENWELVHYHLKFLAKSGVVEVVKVEIRDGSGFEEPCFFFPDPAKPIEALSADADPSRLALDQGPDPGPNH